MPPKKHSSTKESDTYLLIVESPSKCNKIESYLGEKYKCISSKGHIREIDGLSNINTKDRFQIEYTPIKEKRDQIDILKKTVAKYPAANILLATDDDREGEAIAWHICQVCGLDVLSTKRIVFHEITQPALVEAVSNPSRINLSLVAAQQARQVLDMVVGFKISPLLWRHIGGNRKNALSAGRCQTPALRLVNDHHVLYKDALAKGSNQIHRVTGVFTNKLVSFQLDKEFTSQEDVVEFLNASKTFEHRLSIGPSRPSTRSAPKPFNTSRLLQIASNQLRLSPKTTMNLCQTLYQAGLITYMRTDCQKYARVFLDKCAKYVGEQFGEKYIGDYAPLELLDGSMPHEAIRVTNLALQKFTNPDAHLVRLYGLIWRNTVESCMSAAKYTVVDVSVSSPSLSRSYKYIVETPVFLGWRKLEARDSADLTGEQATDSGMLFYLDQIAKSDKPVAWSLIESKVAMDSRAPAHYTEASLIQKLEDLGIGRPSTFSTIVETIQDRGYVKKTNVAGIRQQCVEWKLEYSRIGDWKESSRELEYSRIGDWKEPSRELRSILETKSKECEETPENCVRRSLRNADTQNLERIETERIFGEEKDKLVIQPTGELVLEFLVKHFDDCFSYGYTKSMEDELDVVASQSSEKAMAEWFQICRRCFDDISERSKPLARQTKQTFALADTSDYVLIFNSYGASLKRVGEDVEYAKVRPDATIELEKAKRGEYTAAELIWREDNGCLGTYQNAPVYLKKGKYGLYAEYGNKETVNLKSVDKSPDSITLNDVVAVIKSKSAHVMSESDAAAMFLPCSELEPCANPTKEGYGVNSLLGSFQSPIREYSNSLLGSFQSPIREYSNAPETSKAIIRSLRPDLSIRKGKYGPYIFHKTAAMSKPEFYALKPIIKKWQEMADLELIAWIENTYRVNI